MKVDEYYQLSKTDWYFYRTSDKKEVCVEFINELSKCCLGKSAPNRVELVVRSAPFHGSKQIKRQTKMYNRIIFNGQIFIPMIWHDELFEENDLKRLYIAICERKGRRIDWRKPNSEIKENNHE